MTDGVQPNNTRTYEIDVDDVGTVPDCTEIKKDTSGDNVYSTPFQTEPVYESPLGLGVTSTTDTAHTRESDQQNGRRLRENNLYEATNDDTLLRCYTGYSYVTNTDCVLPRLPKARFAYDNPVQATAGEDGYHDYEENFRNSRFSENVVYRDSRASEGYTIQGIRDTKNGGSRNSWCSDSSGKQRTTCVQKITLLLSILALLVGILALLVALRTIKFNDDQNKNAIGSAQEYRSGESDRNTGENNKKPGHEVSNEKNTLADLVLSLKQNYTELLGKYNGMVKQGLSLKQNYTKLLEKYDEILKQFNSKLNVVNKFSHQLEYTVKSINSTFTKQLKKVNSNVSSLSRELGEFNTELRSVDGFSQQLSNTLEDINSTFTTQIKNISKEMGPRGFNGSQGLPGPQGLPGIGNISACIVKEKSTQKLINGNNAHLGEVTHSQTPGWKVISAVCSTKREAGALHTVLSIKGDQYTCKCAGVSTDPSFKPVQNANGELFTKCVIIYWECPELT